MNTLKHISIEIESVENAKAPLDLSKTTINNSKLDVIKNCINKIQTKGKISYDLTFNNIPHITSEQIEKAKEKNWNVVDIPIGFQEYYDNIYKSSLFM